MSALSYRFLKLIYGTWLVEIAKEIIVPFSKT